MNAAFVLTVLMGFVTCSSLIAQTHNNDAHENAPVADQMAQGQLGTFSTTESVLLAATNGPPQEAPGGQQVTQEQEPTHGQGGSPSPQDQPKSYLDVYGFVMLDMGYDVKTNDPNWFDVMRPSKLPSVPGEFGKDGNTYFCVRQSRFGVNG